MITVNKEHHPLLTRPTVAGPAAPVKGFADERLQAAVPVCGAQTLKAARNADAAAPARSSG